MPIVKFLPSQKQVEVAENTSLYDAAEQAGLPVASSCSANFTCGKCNMQIAAAPHHLSEQTQAEQSLLAREGKPITDRISCRTWVLGDCEVTTTYW